MQKLRMTCAAVVLSAAAIAAFSTVVFAQWPTTCVDLNDIVEAHLGNDNNVGIYQRVFGDQAEAACQNDHRDDVRGVFAWAFDEADLATQTVLPDLAWPTDCVELNDIVEAHLGNDNNVEIYQRVFGDQAEPACRNDHGADVRGVFAWAFDQADRAPPAPTPTPTSAESASPTWMFAGDISEEDQTMLRDEMEAVRTWFSDQHGVEATGFTVLVGDTAEALAPNFRDVTGYDLSEFHVPAGLSGPFSQLPDPFVATADDGSPVLILIYGSNVFDRLKDSIAHEYFHMLQDELLAPRYQTSDVEPYWLVEGTAQYADHAYSQSRPGRRPFLGDRYTPYEDLGESMSRSESITPRHLESIATESAFRDGSVHPILAYSLAFAGADLLVEIAGEDSVVEFWKILQQRPTWQQAFEEAFGMGIEDFYDSFAEWLPEQIPSFVEIYVWLHWPGKETLPADELNRIRWNTSVGPDDVIAWPAGGMGWGGSTAEGAHTIVYTAGDSWTGKLGLWFDTDECTTASSWLVQGWRTDGSACRSYGVGVHW